MSHPQTELLAAPAFQFPSGEVVTCWDGPSPGRDIRPDREAEYRRAEALLAVGIAHIRDEPRNYAVARRCFHSAVCLFAWALGADRRLAFAWDRLGFAYQSLGNDDEAERCYLRSLAIQDRSEQQRTRWNHVTLLNLAKLYALSGRASLHRAVLFGGELMRERGY